MSTGRPRGGPPPPELGIRPFSLQHGLRHDTRSRLYGPAYQGLTRGAFFVADAEVTHGRRIQALRTVLPPEAVLGGRSAAWALGVRLAGADDPVEVVLPQERRVRQRRELRVRGESLPGGEIVRNAFGLLTSPARTAFDLARVQPPGEALGWVDAVLRATGTDPAAALAVLQAHFGVRGVRQARRLLPLADARSESVRESALRWLLAVHGLPSPTPQFLVADGDLAPIARLDLAWPQVKVAVEYDGRHHQECRQYERDLLRHNRLRALGWVVIQVDAAQLRAPDRLVHLVATTLRSAGLAW